jgi:hypothetical protein
MNYDVMGGAKRSACSAWPRTPLPYTTYCASKMCANLKNCLPTINQVRSEIRYTIYSPFAMQYIHALFYKLKAAASFPVMWH